MADELLPRPRVCAVCLHEPCHCPDPSDESDEQGAEAESNWVRGLLRGDFDTALAVEVTA